MTRVVALLPLIPLAAALLLALRGTSRGARMALLGWAPVPALAVALFGGTVEPHQLQWALLETHAGLDTIGRVWLFFTALLWTVSGFYARAYHQDDPKALRYALFHLLTLSGNLGLIVAQDAASFYLGFALMTFAGYGLVVHSGGDEARRAGRVYLVMAVVGETMLLAALILAATFSPSLSMHDIAATIAASPRRDLMIALLLAGFGIKAGALPLHMWLPLAHPVAPTPASAVLSGAMIKAGLLGWIRFLPLGAVALPGWSAVIIGLGIAAAFFGVIAGVGQRDAKTTLAYSSISQMGFLNVGVGAALAAPDAWPAAIAAILAYVVHHGLAKGALFLGVGVVGRSRSPLQRKASIAGLAFAALAITGAPLTSGSIAKTALKDVAHLAPVWWPGALDVLLPLAALGSTLLMARFLFLAVRIEAGDERPLRALALPWAVLLASVALVVWMIPSWYELELQLPSLAPSKVWVMIWPVLGGAMVAALVVAVTRRRRWTVTERYIAPGDLLIPLERMIVRTLAWLRTRSYPKPHTPVQTLASRWYGVYATASGSDALSGAELSFTRWQVAGALAVAVVLLVAAALLVG
jgi:formate hydrogenlyase subunit 3/multisubunit Na+/H+ antiporter MnhD subunit